MIPLSEVVWKIQFPKQEWARIAGSIKNGKLPSAILRRQASFCKIFEKIANTGKESDRSEGKWVHTKKAIKFIIDNLNGKDDNNKTKIAREIYRQTIIDYIGHSQGKLNKLLQETNVEERNYSAAEILELLTEKGPSFDVDADSIRRLYELWGFTRIAKIKDVLSKNTFSDDTKMGRQTSIIDVNERNKMPKQENTFVKEKTLQVNSNTEQQIEKIAYQLKAIQTEIKELKNTIGKSGQKYLSPLQKQLPARNEISAQIDDENLFLNLWTNRLNNDENIAIYLAKAAIYHSIFKSSNCIILKDERLIFSWLRTLQWDSFAMNIVASPRWTSEKDWGDAAHYIFDNKASDEPRILIIHNYDQALARAYLVPTLKLWSLSLNQYKLAKIILVSSGSCDKNPSAELLEQACFIPREDPLYTKSLPSSEVLKTLHLNAQELRHTGVDPETFKSWLSTEQQISLAHSDSDAVAKMGGMVFPTSIKFLYAHLQVSLTHFFKEEDSSQIATYHAICPWIATKHGEDRKNQFYEILKSFFPKAIKY